MEIRTSLQIALQALHFPPQGGTSKAPDWLGKRRWLHCKSADKGSLNEIWLNFFNFCCHFEVLQLQAAEVLKAKIESSLKKNEFGVINGDVDWRWNTCWQRWRSGTGTSSFSRRLPSVNALKSSLPAPYTTSASVSTPNTTVTGLAITSLASSHQIVVGLLLLHHFKVGNCSCLVALL